ncbi:MAG: type IV pilus twitching motility protein PilT [Candidatus Eremiobacteraeota bacterium]|nr:type IV pilus twitching motility protein PilT [Candidatus Eremiobacteraeota bacterium]MBV8221735.1 type IV pilus twitching motility protein PilT [Candidatus Eremiobacteraeota bacterium]
MLTQTVLASASDLHIVADCPPTIRINGELGHLNDDVLRKDDMDELLRQILTDKQYESLVRERELDTAYSLADVSRFRVNMCYEREHLSASFRAIPSTPPKLEEMELPKVVTEYTQKPRGLVLVTGPTGSGKTTTLAAMVDYINRHNRLRIVTIEDPIEFEHHSDLSVITQREIGHDTKSEVAALRSALRQDPDVILVGEMRDLDTIKLAMTAAETGHLVFGTLHVTSAPESINRIIDVFPVDQQEQVRVQLAGSLEAVFTQCLIPRLSGTGRICAMEVLLGTPAVRNLVRENKPSQMMTAMQTGTQMGMQSLEKHLSELVGTGKISRDNAVEASSHPEELRRVLGTGPAAPRFPTHETAMPTAPR